MFELRDYEKNDLPTLTELYQTCRGDALGPSPGVEIPVADFEADTEGEQIWVAVQNRQPIGFVACWMPENFIHHLYVARSARGLGIGSALLQRALTAMGRPATLKCVSANQRAVDFYTRHHWQIESEDLGPQGNYFLMKYEIFP